MAFHLDGRGPWGFAGGRAASMPSSRAVFSFWGRALPGGFAWRHGAGLRAFSGLCGQGGRVDNEILMSLRMEKKLAGEVSFSDPIGVDKDGNEISLVEVLGSDAEEVQKQVELALFGAQLREAMDKTLTQRERTVIELRYGLAGGQIMPQREIAKLLGISRSYVSRMEKKALAKLTREFET